MATFPLDKVWNGRPSNPETLGGASIVAPSGREDLGAVDEYLRLVDRRLPDHDLEAWTSQTLVMTQRRSVRPRN